MNIKNELDLWDQNTLKPIISAVGKTIEKVGVEGVLSPVANIMGGAIVAIIENGANINCAYQDAILKVNRKKEEAKAIREIDKKIINGLTSLYDNMINIILDQNTQITEKTIAEVYRRIQFLSALSINNQKEVKNLEKNFKSLISNNYRFKDKNTIVIDCR